MSKRIGRGTVDTRHRGESHIDAVHCLIRAMLAIVPSALRSFRRRARAISDEGPGPSATLTAFLKKLHLEADSETETLDGVRLHYEFAQLASVCVKHPRLSWLNVLKRSRGRRDSRLRNELASAYESDRRASYVRSVRRACRPRSPHSNIVGPIIAKFDAPCDSTEHAELARHFHMVQKLTGVRPHGRWCWPRVVDHDNPLAPIQPDPLFETEEEFIERALSCWRTTRAEGKRLGFPDTPLLKALRRFEWFVRYQIQGRPLHEIMRDAPGIASRSAVRDGVHAVGKALGVRVRHGDSGRPKGAKAVQPFRRGR